MKRVIIESPFAAETDEGVAANVRYARACLLDSLRRGESPLASHLLYTQVLDDTDPDERRMGIEAGLAWGRDADLVAVYIDRGISPGMRKGITRAASRGTPVVTRALYEHGSLYLATARDAVREICDRGAA